mmetsp:Transcript_26995/g.26059  ORF Transcript_26995/g.26059 Transcript_26995/m.26059 type:complete len:110 (+) Transcript_26995:59-388(+)
MLTEEDKDQHSPVFFAKFNDYIKESNMNNVRIRGLRVTMHDDMSHMNFCEAEICCKDENGLVNLADVIQNCSQHCTFIKLKISYDIHKDNIESNRKLSTEGCKSLTYLF